MKLIILLIISLTPLKFTDYEKKAQETFTQTSSYWIQTYPWRSTLMIKCLHPVKIRDPSRIPSTFEVPCGKCSLCLSQRRASWSFRLKNELKNSTSAYFITLTYNEENCPALCSRDHVRDFIKRFRTAISPNRIRYFLVCEYGGKFGRPHYHMLLFNYIGSRESLRTVLKSTWKFCDSFMFDYGDVVGDCEMASINYVVKYCLNTLSDDDVSHLSFISCSRYPYIGESYLSDNLRIYARKRFDGMVVSDGKKIPLSRAYMDKIFTQPERALIALVKYRNNIRKQLNDYQLKGHELLETLENPTPLPYEDYKLFMDGLQNRDLNIRKRLKK